MGDWYLGVCNVAVWASGAALTSDVSSMAVMSWDEQGVGTALRWDEHSGIDMPAVWVCWA
jgi:hypothetical protein